MTVPPLPRYDESEGTASIRGGRIVQEWSLPNGHAWRDTEHMHRVLAAWYWERQPQTTGEPRRAA